MRLSVSLPMGNSSTNTAFGGMGASDQSSFDMNRYDFRSKSIFTTGSESISQGETKMVLAGMSERLILRETALSFFKSSFNGAKTIRKETPMGIDFRATYHAVERLKERCPDLCAKHPELRKWKREDGMSQIRGLMRDLVDGSSENRSYINDTAKMANHYEKYGYNNDFKVMENKEVGALFLMVRPRDSDGPYMMVTSLANSSYVAQKKSFSGRETKGQRAEREKMEWYDRFSKTKFGSASSSSVLDDLIANGGTKEMREGLLGEVMAGRAKLKGKIGKKKDLYEASLGGLEYEFELNAGNSVRVLGTKSKMRA